MARELSYLLAELQDCEDVIEAEYGTVNGVIGFNARSQCYERLTSQILTILGRYDVSLRVSNLDEIGHDFYLTYPDG